MIIAVGGVCMDKYSTSDDRPHYKQEYYQPKTKEELNQDIEKDFGKILAIEKSKLNIDIII